VLNVLSMGGVKSELEAELSPSTDVDSTPDEHPSSIRPTG